MLGIRAMNISLEANSVLCEAVTHRNEVRTVAVGEIIGCLTVDPSDPIKCPAWARHTRSTSIFSQLLH